MDGVRTRNLKKHTHTHNRAFVKVKCPAYTTWHAMTRKVPISAYLVNTIKGSISHIRIGILGVRVVFQLQPCIISPPLLGQSQGIRTDRIAEFRVSLEVTRWWIISRIFLLDTCNLRNILFKQMQDQNKWFCAYYRFFLLDFFFKLLPPELRPIIYRSGDKVVTSD